MNREFETKKSGFHIPTLGTTIIFNPSIPKKDLEATRTHEIVHQYLSDRSTLIYFIKMLETIEVYCDDVEHAELIKYIINKIYRLSKRVQESVAIWVEWFCSKYRHLLNNSMEEEIEIPAGYLEYIGNIDKATKFTPAPEESEAALNIIQCVANVGVISLRTNIFQDMSSPRPINKESVDQYFAIDKNDPGKRLDLLTEYIITNSLPIAHFSFSDNSELLEEINSNLFRVPLELDVDRLLKDSYLVKQSGSDSIKSLEENIKFVEKLTSREIPSSRPDLKWLQQHQTYILSRQGVNSEIISYKEFVKIIKKYKKKHNKYFLEVRPTWNKISKTCFDIDKIFNLSELKLSFYESDMKHIFSTVGHWKVLNKKIKNLIGPQSVLLFSSYLFFFDTQRTRVFDNDAYFCGTHQPITIVIPATSSRIVERFIDCLREKNFPISCHVLPKEDNRNLWFLAIRIASMKSNATRILIYIPSHRLGIYEYAKLFEKDAELNFCAPSPEEWPFLDIQLKRIANYLRDFGWALESSENKELEGILHFDVFNIPAETERNSPIINHNRF